ncbi:MAG: DUF3696 domain-containing protein [Chloroflexi bacterium]|nr:DUF3696 domain-containing protein [Chloroflexota bacterium]
MLTQLRFSNFKSWADDHSVDFGRITGLFGPNSSGKSAILQTLLLLKQTAERREPNLILNFGGERGDYADFGSYAEIIHGRDYRRKLSLGITWTGLYPRDFSSLGNVAASEHSLDVQISADRPAYGQVRVERIKQVLREFQTRHGRKEPNADPEMLTNEMEIEIWHRSPEQDEYEVRLRSLDNIPISLPADRKYKPYYIHRIPNRVTLDIGQKAEETEDDLDAMLTRYEWVIQALFTVSPINIDEFMENIDYLGPVREEPRRLHQWRGVLPPTVGRRGESAIEIFLASEVSGGVISKRPSPSDNGWGRENYLEAADVENWLRRLDVAASITPVRAGRGRQYWELMLRPPNVVGYQANLADVGFGVSQVLPVVVALLYARPGSTVLLEHPEIHLHPKVQMDLVDFFIYAAKERNIQIVFESHSEYMLARLQRRLAESNGSDSPVSTDDVKLYFCSLENGQSVLDPLEVNRNGSIQNWPPDFFGDTFTERMAIAKANIPTGD